VNPQQLRLKAWLPNDLDPEVARVMVQALDEFGVEVRTNQLPGFNDLSEWANQVLCKEVSQTYSKALQDANAEPGVRSLAKFGATLTEQAYQDAIHQRQKRCAEFLLQNLADADLLIFPALQVPLPDWQEVEIGASSFCKPKFLGMQIKNLFDFFMIFVYMAGASAILLFSIRNVLFKLMHGIK
jgi:Asp-tRNA(Asn)/Glu-tRNA(Gln) amidotransferase A subunit family amidase